MALSVLNRLESHLPPEVKSLCAVFFFYVSQVMNFSYVHRNVYCESSVFLVFFLMTYFGCNFDRCTHISFAIISGVENISLSF